MPGFSVSLALYGIGVIVLFGGFLFIPQYHQLDRGLSERIGALRGSVVRLEAFLATRKAVGELVLDTHRMSATFGGRPIRLSQLEFRFLDYLAHQSGRAVSAGALEANQAQGGRIALSEIYSCQPR